MEGDKPMTLLRLLLVFLIFSYLLSSSGAAPLSRSLKMVDEVSFAQDLSMEQNNLMEEDDAANYRMLLGHVENNDDYQTGPNPRHNPPPRKRL